MNHPSRSELIDHYKQKEYIKKHLLDYANLFKEIYSESKFALNTKLILDRYDAFFGIMKMIELGELQKIYDSVSEKQFENIYQRIEAMILKS